MLFVCVSFQTLLRCRDYLFYLYTLCKPNTPIVHLRMSHNAVGLPTTHTVEPLNKKMALLSFKETGLQHFFVLILSSLYVQMFLVKRYTENKHRTYNLIKPQFFWIVNYFDFYT